MIQATSDPCTHCLSEKVITYKAPNDRSYCVSCMRKVYPPFMTLVEFSSLKQHTLYNIEVGRFEEVKDIETFKLCGWEIRMKQRLEQSGVTLYRLEYEGTACCARCNDYPWPLDGVDCWAHVCLKFTKKKEEHLRKYPNSGSVYLSWKYNGGHKKDVKTSTVPGLL